MTTAAQYWLQLGGANDEPEPVIPASTRLRSILEAGQEIARNEVRRSRTAVPVLTAEEAGRS